MLKVRPWDKLEEQSEGNQVVSFGTTQEPHIPSQGSTLSGLPTPSTPTPSPWLSLCAATHCLQSTLTQPLAGAHCGYELGGPSTLSIFLYSTVGTKAVEGSQTTEDLRRAHSHPQLSAVGT